jgi:hypothetical protein
MALIRFDQWYLSRRTQMVRAGDRVADIGILDIEGKVMEAGPQVARVKWANHHAIAKGRVQVTENYVSVENLVPWASEAHRAMVKEFPDRIWDKATPIGQSIKKPLREAPVDLMALFRPEEENNR